ncbi:DnaJ domain-containing protein [Caenispirillum bisanense]|uniref:DnaJ domain-containing protein n=1 Tax=Caenispirillum bisanense TaxID=414052 RepID=A0A286GRK3_9PROT|nr:DnaJ domain-containing protein [Caenispirillum bisanense]SOD98158.1 DnaJ domain-containing protein [Caenispirillum bisanense]
MLLGAVILGVGLLVAFLLLGQWYVNAQPRDIIRGLKRAAVVLLLLGVVALAATGRLGWALALLAGLAPWAGKILRLLFLGHLLRRSGLFGGPGGFSTPGGGGFGFGMPGGGSGRARGQASDVMTAWLSMTLDHDTGAMAGRVLQGPYLGRELDSLSPEERLDLWRQVQADADSARIYEAWLDRADPDWRAAGGSGAQDAPPPDDGPMTRGDALKILGLTEGADAAEIKSAYRRLMRQMHPDHGGSSWMAAKLNEAKKVLLGE